MRKLVIVLFVSFLKILPLLILIAIAVVVSLVFTSSF